MTTWLANRYWLIWFIVMMTAFLVPEIYSLVVRRPQGTLSDTLWRLEGEKVDGSFGPWTAFHFLFIGALLVIFVWLIFHFGWGWFR